MDRPAMLDAALISRAPNAPMVPPGAGRAQAEKAGKEFEAMFIAQMLAPMFAGLKSDGPFGGGPSEEVYRSLMVEEYGRLIAANGGIGLADTITREILKAQEAATQ